MMHSTNQTTKGEMHMDDYDAKVFYKGEIAKLVDQATDVNLLDLVYKLLLSGM